MVGQLALETEHERIADLPGGRGRAPARFNLGEGVVEGATSRAALRKRLGCVFVGPEEGLARPRFRATGCGGQAVRFHPRKGPLVYCFVHRVQREVRCKMKRGCRRVNVRAASRNIP